MRRVLMTGDTVGGVWTFTLELAEALGALGIEVVLATFGGPVTAGQWEEAARPPRLTLVPSDFRLEWMPDPWQDVADSASWLLRLAHQFQPDIVHLNSFGHGGLPFAAPVVLTFHSCVLSWWEAVKGGAAPSDWNRYAAMVEKSLRSATRVTAPSHAMASAVEKHYGVRKALIDVIPNGRKASDFYTARKEPFVFTAGRLQDEAKNVAALVEIAPKLSWPVYAAGDWRGGSVEALGPLSADQIKDWYARAAIYALPALYEPFGLSALEAALSGCALVLGDIPSLREVWGDAALFVDPHDSEALRQAIECLIENEALRENLARRGYARALTYPSGLVAERYLAVYEAHVVAACA